MTSLSKCNSKPTQIRYLPIQKAVVSSGALQQSYVQPSRLPFSQFRSPFYFYTQLQLCLCPCWRFLMWIRRVVPFSASSSTEPVTSPLHLFSRSYSRRNPLYPIIMSDSEGLCLFAFSWVVGWANIAQTHVSLQFHEFFGVFDCW